MARTSARIWSATRASSEPPAASAAPARDSRSLSSSRRVDLPGPGGVARGLGGEQREGCAERRGERPAGAPADLDEQGAEREAGGVDAERRDRLEPLGAPSTARTLRRTASS